MTIQTLDLKPQYEAIGADVQVAVLRVLESQHFILGPEVDSFEKEIAAHIGTRHAIGVSSGTDALLAALMALDIGQGDEVVTTPYTFFATAGAVSRLGATPVFVDIDPVSFNLDPDLLEASITPRTRAIIAVHLFGQCLDMDRVLAVAQNASIPVIEDAAQAIGATHHGKNAGTMSELGCFSFFPSKNLGGIGDGGLVTTDDPDLAYRLRILRNHGAHPKYTHHVIGGNFRLDAINAAVLRVKLPHLPRWAEGRRGLAGRYDELITGTGLVGEDGPILALPRTAPGAGHVFNQYVIRVQRREELREHMQQAGVSTAVYYPSPLHLQPCFRDLGYDRGSLPQSELASEQSLALPCYPELPRNAQEQVVRTMLEFFTS